MKAIPREVKEEIREVVERELILNHEVKLEAVREVLMWKYQRLFCSDKFLNMLIEQAKDEIVYIDLEA